MAGKIKTYSSKTIYIIYGPTASGKSAQALEMAARTNGVIINADSMQVYDALHFLTAQPSRAEQDQVPHKLYAVLGPAQRCSAALWRGMAMAEIEKALASGRTPIVVGGTGFYIKALLQGLSPIPDVPEEVRMAAEKKQQALGNPAFHAELEKRDSVMAAKLNPNDTQRLIRAWEILKATGKSLAYWQSLPPEGPPADWRFERRFVNPPRETLYRRCDTRFDQMLQSGILDEVKAFGDLIACGDVPEDAAITNALGFKPLCDHLRGGLPVEEAVAQAKQDTRNYAKRQITWFRNQMG